MRTRFTLLFPIVIAIVSCHKRTDLQNFNSQEWKKDAKSCSGKRKDLLPGLLQNRENLKRMDDDDLIELLGKPENYVYYSRGKKDYAYYIEPGKQCSDSLPLEGKKLVVEFDALGFVSILTVQE